MSLLAKIQKAGLVGRGGAEFPTATKWEFVKKAKGDKKYVICNASEGELGLFKDVGILEKHPEQVFRGMQLAMDFLGTKDAYFNFNKRYYEKLKKSIDALIKKYKKNGYTFTVFQEEPSYIGGEETTLLNAIEGLRIQPRLKPPYPASAGLFGKPTLVHNVETLFNVAAVNDGTYEDKRFYCISGEVKKRGVYHLPANWSIKKVLEETKNIPTFDFFVQIGGSASGLVLNENQLDKHTMVGAGSIEVYKASMKPIDLLTKWFKFYAEESCGKCTPCRVGSYNLYKLIKDAKKIPWKEISEIIDTMEKTSFCALGKSVAQPVRSYAKNVLNIKL
jgi:NADH:ubiquinone oxidoreductase subunit F (NADH-binding)